MKSATRNTHSKLSKTAPRAKLFRGDKSNLTLKEHALTIYRALRRAHPDAKIALVYQDSLQLMVATILSAQCTDLKVNQVTPELFHRFPTAASYLKADVSEIEKIIRPTGFFRQKAKSIYGCMQRIVAEFGGEVPADMETLSSFPGIGRKTANVILGNAFGVPGLPVDTHVRRLCNRIGLTDQDDPVKIESELCALVPKKEWTQFSHTLIFHGRRVCNSRKPLCEKCVISECCDYFSQNVQNQAKR